MKSFETLIVVTVLTASVILGGFHQFPTCDEVCGRYLGSYRPYFSFEIWNVTCQDQMCLTWTRWYHRSTVPRGPNVTNFRVDYDLRVLYFDEFEVNWLI